MKGKIIAVMVLGLVIMPAVLVSAGENEVMDESKKGKDVTVNQAPTKPRITGPVSCKIGESYTYLVSSSDPQNDKIYYEIVYSDMPAIYRTDFYSSGEEIQLKHSWSTFYQKSGPYSIHVTAIDEDGHESPSATYEVNIPGKSKTSYLITLFQSILERLMNLHPVFSILLHLLYLNLPIIQ